MGRCEVLRDGGDLLILAVGALVYPALEAARSLAGLGVDATVVNARFIKPLDGPRLLPLMARIRRVLTLEENVLAGGFGSAVLELLHDGTGIPGEVEVLRLGIPDVFVEHGSQRELRAKYSLDPEGIVQAVLQWMARPALRSMERKGGRG